MSHVEGWYPDPERPGWERWWDGTTWSEFWRPCGDQLTPRQRSGSAGGAGLIIGIVVVVFLFVALAGGDMDAANQLITAAIINLIVSSMIVYYAARAGARAALEGR